MKILFMGTPLFAVPSLEALVAAGHQVVGVFSQPDKPKNRGMKLQPTPVKVCAQVHDIPVFQPTRLRDGAALETIRQLEPDLIVVAAYGRILPQEILELSPAGVRQRPLLPAAQVPGGGPHQLGHPQRGEGDRGDHHAHGPGPGCGGHHRPAGHPH